MALYFSLKSRLSTVLSRMFSVTAEGGSADAAKQERWPANPYLWLLALVFMLALAVRAVGAFTRPLLLGDEVVYLRMAENLDVGLGPLDLSGLSSTVFFPLFSLFVAGIAPVLGNPIISGFVVSVLFGALLVIPVYVLAFEMGGKSLAIRAALLAAVFPLLVDYSSKLYSETVYVFFLVMACAFFWRVMKRGGWLNGALTGVSLGLAYLSNPAAVYYIVLFVSITLFCALYRRKWRLVSLAAVTIILFTLFASPYVFFLHSELGRWTFSGKNATANIDAALKDQRLFTPEWEQEAYALTPDNEEVKINKQARENRDPISFIVSEPALAEQMVVRDVRIFMSEELRIVVPVILLPLLAAGLLSLAWSGADGRRKTLFLLSLLVPTLVIFAVGDFRERFFIPFVPIAIIFISQGWLWLEIQARERIVDRFTQKSRTAVALLATLMIGALVLLPVMKTTYSIMKKNKNTRYYSEYKEAGEWLRDTAGPGARIMNRDYISAYYAGGTVVLLPFDDYEDTNEYAQNKEVDYMILSPAAIPEWRPGMVRLLGDDDQHPEWKLVHTVNAGSGKEVRIYEFEI